MLGVDYRHIDHVEDVFGRGSGIDQMRRFLEPEQHRSDGYPVAIDPAEQLVRQIGRIPVGKDQYIGSFASGQGRKRKALRKKGIVQRKIRLYLPVNDHIA